MSQELTNDHQIGALSARVEIMERNFLRLESRIERQLEAMEMKLDDMHEMLTSAKGGWRALVGVGSAVAILASMFAALFHWGGGK